MKAALDAWIGAALPVPALHNLVQRMPPVVAHADAGTGGLRLNVALGHRHRHPDRRARRRPGHGLLRADLARDLLRDARALVRLSLLTIAAMLALGFTTRYSGLDATLGLAFAGTGVLYPFFGTMLGWLGVALTGSDTSSNVLFGSLQRITAEQLGLNPVLMAAANSSGGVMGKMIDAQSIVVASTATRWYGHEGDILRYVFWHSVALAALVGLLVLLQAYVSPFSQLVGW